MKWRDVQRGWNLARGTAKQAARGVGEALGIGPEDPRAAARAALEEELAAIRAGRTAGRAGVDPGVAAPRSADPAPPPPASPTPEPVRDLSEAELEDRIRRRTL